MHCQWNRKCVEEYDRSCDMMMASIGSRNRRLFFLTLVLFTVSTSVCTVWIRRTAVVTSTLPLRSALWMTVRASAILARVLLRHSVPVCCLYPARTCLLLTVHG